jgi:hypothetical protein
MSQLNRVYTHTYRFFKIHFSIVFSFTGMVIAMGCMAEESDLASSTAHPASYPVVSKDSFYRGKASGA